MRITSTRILDVRALGGQDRATEIGVAGEEIVADILEQFDIDYQMTGYSDPLDIIVNGGVNIGIEVKTICTKTQCLNIPKKQKQRKKLFCKENGLRGATVLVNVQDVEFSEETGKLVEISELKFRWGFKCFPRNKMNDFSELLEILKGGIVHGRNTYKIEQ